MSKNIFSDETIIKGMPELAYVFNKENRLEMWNKNLETILGYTKEELQQKYITDFIAKEDREKTLETIMRVFTKKKEQTIEYHLVTKHGEYLPYIGSGSFATANNKEYIIGIAIDISKQKNAEEKLKAQTTEINRLKNRLQAENIYLREEIKIQHNFDEIIGTSESLMQSLYRVEQISQTDTTVLLQGETGTGKELFARAIHNLSNRRNHPFIKIDCASLPNNISEGEFFGYVSNAFIEGDNREIGKFEIANHGTIFLDEIDLVSVELQSKLLAFFQEKKLKKTKNSKTIQLDLRIITSTNQNLEELVKRKGFLKDLFFYLNVFPIIIPPLRERLSDMPLLVESFLKRFNKKYAKSISKIPKKVIALLENYSWPGNIRELENVIERSVILSNTPLLKVEQMLKPSLDKKDNILTLNEYEREYIIKILNLTFWRISGDKGAAKILGLHPETLRSKMRKLGIQRQ